MDLFLTNMQLFASQDWWTGDGLLWCFHQLFGLSFWRHPFTAEDPLVNKWCYATFLQICSNEETNSSKVWIAWGCVHLHFWVNYSFKLKDSSPVLKYCLTVFITRFVDQSWFVCQGVIDICHLPRQRRVQLTRCFNTLQSTKFIYGTDITK